MINLGWFYRVVQYTSTVQSRKILYSSFGRATSISFNGYPTTMIKQDSQVPHPHYSTHPSHSRIRLKQLADAHQPTRRTRHVEMKHFIILQWTGDKFIDFIDTSTDENYSDSLSKPTGRTKFYKHTDVFMGRRKPAYTSYIDHSNTKTHIRRVPG
jgi:hypothetical protein